MKVSKRFAEDAALVLDSRLKTGHKGHRELLAERHGVSVSTVDKYIRDLRDRGLLPPAATGRPRTVSRNR